MGARDVALAAWPARDAREAVGRRLSPGRPRGERALREVLPVWIACLVVVFAAGSGAYLIFGPLTNLPGVFDPPGLIDQFGSHTKDVLVALTALFPMAFFMTAVYPEGLLLPLSAGAFWYARRGRQLADPFSGAWEAVSAAVAGARQLISGQSAHVYWPAATAYGYSPDTAASYNLTGIGFLVFYTGEFATWHMVA